MDTLSDQQLLRYSRHLLLPELDLDGQLALLRARVMIIGLGGLGSPVALYLAASGVGELILVDDDQVELSNLQRQIIHGDADLGRAKVDSAATNLRALNPDCQVTAIQRRADQTWLQQQLDSVDVVLDCTDNADIRYQLNQACLTTLTPWLSAAATGTQGQWIWFDPRDSNSPCYRCLYPDLSSDGLSCADSGVLAPLVGVIGSLQALEALKFIARIGDTRPGRLKTFDALTGDQRCWELPGNPHCPDCGQPE
ncbi:molybdopterin-synthase adenylyltransferase MoeB [Oceanobacter sp. 5_MG-2023]|uniref:HesA/MoeB/ThiF family protein n=1 Tax=Oceanobacter sp. 5_MG-2023 TaxID=3062645 RepID=UPI0026E36F78|nr:molybdopterin-synthase adenylyltransferase MoeB [Oceanobacter sp. 5_MG-2023]MDO6682233.1 molybdopterin-synthase adenylyltransferase MoeB [Oceanobacter sp. 5_MG-2023]